MHTVQIYLVLLYYHQGIYTVGAIDFSSFQVGSCSRQVFNQY